MSEELGPGKVILIYLKQQGKRSPWGGAITNARIERVGDQTFVTGEKIPSAKGHWADGRKTWFLASEIASMFELENVETYRATLGKRRRRLRGFLR